MGTDDPSSKTSWNIELGKEIDSALGDVIRGLLAKPAEETGSLIADTIGIVGDRIKRKRELNTQRALEETRLILESKNVEMTRIAPPSEEDLHVVLTGMSLASDDLIRKLWAALFAEALDPNCETSIQRPITSAIEALSPLDAKILHYGAFVTNSNLGIEKKTYKIAGIEQGKRITVGEYSKLREIKNGELKQEINSFFDDAQNLFDLYNFSSLNSSWADNLIRLGLIRPIEYNRYKPRVQRTGAKVVDTRILEQVIEGIYSDVQDIIDYSKFEVAISFLMKKDTNESLIRLGFEFTRFGEDLCKSCKMLER